MQVRHHQSVDEFRAVAGTVYRRDPVVHTVELTALRDPPASDAALDGVLLTVWSGGKPIGAAMQTPPYPLLCNGLPEQAIATVATELARVRPRLAALRGVRDTTTAFADAWCAVTGHAGTVTTEERLYRLATLRVPGAVTGAHRYATDADSDVLVGWLDLFFAQTFGELPDHGAREQFVRKSGQAGDHFLLWVVDGSPVSMAMVRAPESGVARIGPVFTPLPRRGHGYGSAATAAAAEWARCIGADDVVLFADLANPVSNAIYQRIGFAPVCDSVRIDVGTPV
jgi:predicted GNAT family acetyltransferase